MEGNELDNENENSMKLFDGISPIWALLLIAGVRFSEHSKNKSMEKCCENCVHAQMTDIDGLIDCKKDGRSKDYNMVCDEYEER